jgi:aryl-alcohol dehydrogenase-like predicted oxidoreductase
VSTFSSPSETVSRSKSNKSALALGHHLRHPRSSSATLRQHGPRTAAVWRWWVPRESPSDRRWSGVVPAVNQVELYPRLPQTELREVHARLGIATEAWGPLGQGSLLTDPTVTAVAEGCGRTPAQVLIRWHIQLGNIVIPKSVNPERIASNFDVFDFELSENDMASISSLDDGNRLGPDPRTFDFIGR